MNSSAPFARYQDILLGQKVFQAMSDEIISSQEILCDLVARYKRRLFISRGSEASVVERIVDSKNPNQFWEVVFYHPERTGVLGVSFISDGVLVMESRDRDVIVVGVTHRAVIVIHQNLQLLFDGLQELLPELRVDLEEYAELGKVGAKKRPSSR